MPDDRPRSNTTIATPIATNGVQITKLSCVDGQLLATGRPVRLTHTVDPSIARQAAVSGGDVLVCKVPDTPWLILLAVLRAPSDSMTRAPKRRVIEAADQLELRCGQAQLVLTADGKLSISGTHVSSHSRGLNRISGAAISLN